MLVLSSEQKRRRWLMLGVVASAYVLSFFQRFAPAGIAQDLAAAFQTSATSLGVLAATYFYVYTVLQIPVGVLDDIVRTHPVLAREIVRENDNRVRLARAALEALGETLDPTRRVMG